MLGKRIKSFSRILVLLLFILIVSSLMPAYNPALDVNRDETARNIQGIKQKVDTAQRAKQPFQGDWTPLSPGEISIDTVTDRRFNLTGLIGYERFNIGDKLRITYDDGANGLVYAWWYIGDVYTDYIITLTSSSYVWSGSAPIAYDYSKAAAPTGFDAFWTYTPARFKSNLGISTSGGACGFTMPSSGGLFLSTWDITMLANEVHLSGAWQLTIGASNLNYVAYEFPHSYSTANVTAYFYQNYIVYDSTAGTYATGKSSITDDGAGSWFGAGFELMSGTFTAGHTYVIWPQFRYRVMYPSGLPIWQP